MFSKFVYKRSPGWIQDILITGRAILRENIRGGKLYDQIYDDIEKSQWLTDDEFNEFQWTKLQLLLEFASTHIPFYKKLFTNNNIKTDQLYSMSDLAQIPLLSKEEVISNPSQFLADNFRGPHFKTSTSGTTGSPLTTYQCLTSISYENAFIQRQLSWAGYQPGEPRAWIRGDLIVPLSQKKPPFWRKNFRDKMLMMSSFHLSEESCPLYVQALEQHNPTLIQAYPSSIFFLARFLENSNQYYKSDHLKGIVTSSESLEFPQKKVIEERMGAKVFNWYGLNERVAAIGTCEHGNYHIISDYGLLETQQYDKEAEEIIGTSFHNPLFQLIRYRTNDLLIHRKDESCPCGRHMPMVKEIIGRTASYIKTADGRHVARLSPIFHNVKGIAEAQIIQHEINEIEIKLVTNDQFSTRQEKEVIKRLKERIGNQTNIGITPVSHIARTKSGKFQDIICNC